MNEAKSLSVSLIHASRAYFLWEGGTKCSGRMFGSSFPSIFTLIKCIASANSSTSRNPSQSTSESFQIFDKTEFGSLDLISSDLAAKKYRKRWSTKNSYFELKISPAPLILPSMGLSASNMGSVRGRSRLQIQSTSPLPASIPSPRL